MPLGAGDGYALAWQQIKAPALPQCHRHYEWQMIVVHHFLKAILWKKCFGLLQNIFWGFSKCLLFFEWLDNKSKLRLCHNVIDIMNGKWLLCFGLLQNVFGFLQNVGYFLNAKINILKGFSFCLGRKSKNAHIIPYNCLCNKPQSSGAMPQCC